MRRSTHAVGIIAILATVILVALLAVQAATSAEFPQGTAAPWEYDPDGTGTAVAQWDDSGTILILQKNAPTPTNSAAGAELIEAAGSGEFTDASFEVRGYCNNGSPRLNIYYGESWETYQTAFLGCARSNDSFTTEDGWTHVNFVCDSEVGLPEEAEVACGENILGAELVQDEEGQTDLRNITLNGLYYGPPVDVPEETVSSQTNRAGYCMPAGQERLRVADGTYGRFVDLFVGSPSQDATYRGAVPAYFLEGKGLSCEVPQGYFLNGTTVDGMYPFAKKV